MSESIYTIGHSTHTLEKFIELLQRHEITAVADVRSKPYSQMNPQFNREHLKGELRLAGVSYVFLGNELGARTENRRCYCNGRVQYELLAQTEEFQTGLQRLQEGVKSHRIALMCAEKDPLRCHRTILISRHLLRKKLLVRHILADGCVENHEESMVRLAKNLKLNSNDMFLSREELDDQAYLIQGQSIAYQEAGESDEKTTASP